MEKQSKIACRLCACVIAERDIEIDGLLPEEAWEFGESARDFLALHYAEVKEDVEIEGDDFFCHVCGVMLDMFEGGCRVEVRARYV